MSMEDIQPFLQDCEEAVDEDAAVGIVADFCRKGGCGNIAALLSDETKKKGSELGALFSCLEQLFLRANTLPDEGNLQNEVVTLAHDLVRNRLRLVYMTLSPSNSAVQVKSAFRALTAAVSINSNIARELATTFNFDDPVIFYNLDRRSKSDTPDCRTKYIQFLISFFLDEDSSVTRALLDRKNVIQNVLSGLVYDDAETVQLFLLALIEKVAQSTVVSKTQKVRVFNHGALDSVMKLYRWEGPEKFKGKDGRAKKKDSKTEEEPEPSEEWKQTRAAIADTAHELMVALCSSHKLGIAFCDFSLGTSGRNLNPLCWHVVQKCPRPWEDAKLSELVSKTLSACPDLLRFYFEQLAAISEPRPGQKWRTFAEYLITIIDSQNINIALSTHEHFGPKQLVTRATYLFLMPQSLSNHVLRDSILSGDVGVQACGVKLALSVLRKAAEFKAALFGEKGATYSDAERNNALKFLREMLAKGMPYADRYIACLNSCMSTMKKTEGELVPADVEIVHLLLQLFGYADTYLQVGSTDLDSFYLSLLADIIAVSNTELLKTAAVQDTWKDVQLEAINLVAASKTISSASIAGNKQTGRHILRTILSMFSNSRDPLIRQRIFSMYFSFMGEGTSITPVELTVWLMVSSGSEEAQHILTEASLKYLDDRSKYMTQLRRALLGSGFEDSDKSKNMLLEAMMEEDFEPDNLAKSGTATEAASLSPLIFAVLEAAENKLPDKYWDAVTRVLISVEPDPDTFLPLFDSALANCCSGEAKSYVMKWTAKAVDKKQKRKPTKEVLGEESNTVFGIEELDSTFSVESPDFAVLLVRQKLLYLKQAQILGAASAGALVTSLDGILEKSHVVGNESVLEDFLRNKVTQQFFDPFSSEPFVRQFVQVVLKHLRTNKDSVVRSTFSYIVHQHLQEFKLSRSQKDLSLATETLKVVSPDSEKCAEILAVFSSSNEASLPIVAVLLKQFAENRLKTQSQPGLDVDVFRRICGLCVGKAVQEHLANMADALKTYLVVYPGALEDIPGYGESDSCAFFTAFASFNSEHFSREGEELASLLVRLDSSRFFLRCLERKLKELAKSPTLGVQTISYVRLTAVYLQHKASHGENIEEAVASEIVKFHSEAVIASIQDPDTYSRNSAASDGEFLQIYSFVVSSSNGKDQMIGYLHQLMEKCNGSPVHGKQLLPFLSVAPIPVLLKLVFQSTIAVCKKTLPSIDLKEHLISYLNVLQDMPTVGEGVSDWLKEKLTLNFMKTCLKFGLRMQESDSEELNEEVEQAKIAGGTLLLLLDAVIGKFFNDEQEESLEAVYGMASSHSDFMPVMINDRDSSREQKGALLKLLVTLMRKNPKLCKTAHIPVYLSAYHATLDVLDQSVFQLLCYYEEHGAYLQHYRPLLWGDVALLTQKSDRTKLLSQQSLQEMLALLDAPVVKRLSENFPVNLRLEAYIDTDTDATLYDPRFLLQSLFHLLSSDEVVPCQDFIQSGCFSLALASLTSRDENMRLLGYSVLSRFYPHLELARFYEKPLWINLIDSLQHALSSIGTRRTANNLRLTSLIGVFLTRAANIMADPQNEMYKIVQNFLLVKPSIDIRQVPEFYVLFNSSESDYKQRRKWILMLLRDGFREHNDYAISSKRKIFRILMTFYDSPLCDEQSKVDVLEIMLAASKVSSVANDLTRNRGVLSWIESLVSHPGKLGFARTQLQRLTDIASQLWQSCCRFERERKEKKVIEEEAVSESESESEPDSSPEEDPAPKRRKIVAKEKKKPLDEGALGSGQLAARFFKLFAMLWTKSKGEVDFTLAEANKLASVIVDVVSRLRTFNAAKLLSQATLIDFVGKLVADSQDLIGFVGDLEYHLQTKLRQEGSKVVNCIADSSEVSVLLTEGSEKCELRMKLGHLVESCF